MTAGREEISPSAAPRSVQDVADLLAAQGYVADRGVASVLFLAQELWRPLFLEGEPGVGKTELAKAFAAATSSRLIRLQCYEGIDVNQALYDWNFTRQMLYIRSVQQEGNSGHEIVREVFGPDFLIRRPLLDALEERGNVVLLIDEIDRADDEFEAFLLELLSDFQVSIPEIGTIRAKGRPMVILTSNRTRDVHDALKRRCLYHWVEFPDYERELEILQLKVPQLTTSLAEQICSVVQGLRDLNLHKPPGVGETLDWASALTVLGFHELDRPALEASVGALLKVREDQELALDSAVLPGQ